MHVSEKTIVQWMNYLRDDTLCSRPRHKLQKRFLECFWDTQLMSKRWVIENYPEQEHGPVYIFGGWFGVMAHLLNDNKMISKIVSIDIDSDCIIESNIFFPSDNIEYVEGDMIDYDYDEKPSVVINTSTEHVSALTYYTWWNNIPDDTTVILQGNDLVIDEHVRPFKDLQEFLGLSKCKKIIDSNETVCAGPNNSTYKRFSMIGYK